MTSEFTVSENESLFFVTFMKGKLEIRKSVNADIFIRNLSVENLQLVLEI